MTYEEAKRRETLRCRTVYLRGWDSALICPARANNPYSREDYARLWRQGREACLKNEPLPEWAACRKRFRK